MTDSVTKNTSVHNIVKLDDRYGVKLDEKIVKDIDKKRFNSDNENIVHNIIDLANRYGVKLDEKTVKDIERKRFNSDDEILEYITIVLTKNSGNENNVINNVTEENEITEEEWYFDYRY